MIDVKDAVKRARDYLAALYAGEALHDVYLEEVERGEDGFWYVTLGFARPLPPENPIISALALPRLSERQYKIFKIDADTGEIRAMRMRTPAA